jgi:hypothetical protein
MRMTPCVHCLSQERERDACQLELEQLKLATDELRASMRELDAQRQVCVLVVCVLHVFGCMASQLKTHALLGRCCACGRGRAGARRGETALTAGQLCTLARVSR